MKNLKQFAVSPKTSFNKHGWVSTIMSNRWCFFKIEAIAGDGTFTEEEEKTMGAAQGDFIHSSNISDSEFRINVDADGTVTKTVRKSDTNIRVLSPETALRKLLPDGTWSEKY